MTVPSATDDWDRHWQDFHDSARVNPAQDMRQRLVLGRLRRLAAARVLDVGSGSGELARVLHARLPAAHLLGLEGSAEGVSLARRKVPEAAFVQCDLRQPQLPDAAHREWATAAVCSEVLEHLEDPRLVLINVKPFLAPGAHLLVTVPGGPMSAFDRHIGHRRHFTRRTLRELLEAAGYDVTGVWGAGFPFFNLYRLVVIARGVRLIGDAGARSRPWLAGAAMRLFGLLFRMNLDRTPLGWQLLAVARPAGKR